MSNQTPPVLLDKFNDIERRMQDQLNALMIELQDHAFENGRESAPDAEALAVACRELRDLANTIRAGMRESIGGDNVMTIWIGNIIENADAALAAYRAAHPKG